MEQRDILTRPAPPPDLTVSYGPGPDQVADVRLPPDTATAPLLLLWHGGFWRVEHDRTHVAPMAVDLAARGFIVASVEYRRTGWPDTLTDVAEAARTVPGLVEGHRRVLYAGHSAGGHLALWAALRNEPRGVLALAPVVDLSDAYHLDLDDGAVEAFLGGGPEEVPDRYAAADPAAGGGPGVPVVLVHGDLDIRVPVAMSRRYAAATGSRLVELPGVDHFALIDPASAAWPAVVDALNSLM